MRYFLLFSKNRIALVLLMFQFSVTVSGCGTIPKPYVGVNPENPQFVRGRPFALLDYLGDFLSKPYQLAFWAWGYGNHRVTEETEAALSEFLKFHDVKDVKVSINQWAPHSELARLVKNPHIAWPYKILFFPSTLIASLIGRPLSGLIISDYYDPGSNTIHIFSDEVAIALHEGGHAVDFASQKYKGTYALLRILPGINVFQEAVASDEAFSYLEAEEQYEELIDSYKVLYPAYATYISGYLPASPFSLLGLIGVGHVIGRSHAYDKKEELISKRMLSDENENLNHFVESV